MTDEFEEYRKLHNGTVIDGDEVYMNPLAILAREAATNFTNYVSEQFEHIAVTYIKSKLKKEQKVR